MVKNLSFVELYPIFRIRFKYKDVVSKRGNATSSYVLNVLKTLFVNFKVFLRIRSYETLIFTSAVNLSLNNNIHKDIVTSYYADNIPKSLLVIRPHKIFKKKQLWTSNFCYESLLLILIIGLTKFFKFIRKSFPFQEQTKEMEISADEIYYRFIAEYHVFNFLFKILNIKRILISSSYNYYGYVYAAKINNIEVIEIQHGLISEGHMGYMYNPNEIKNRLLFPDKIFVYGDLFKQILVQRSNLFSSDQVKIIGSNALELYKTSPVLTVDSQINELRSKFDKIILFTGQYTVDDKSLPLIQAIQAEAPNICFLFLTRYQKELEDYKKRFSNIEFYQGDLKFYDLVKQVDIHATVYSTTFLESLYIGIPNILFDFDQYPQKQFSKFIDKDYPFIFCSNSTQEIIKFIETNSFDSRDTIAKSVEHYFDNNFHENLKKQISEFS